MADPMMQVIEEELPTGWRCVAMDLIEPRVVRLVMKREELAGTQTDYRDPVNNPNAKIPRVREGMATIETTVTDAQAERIDETMRRRVDPTPLAIELWREAMGPAHPETPPSGS